MYTAALEMRLANLEPIESFSKDKLSPSGGNQLETFTIANSFEFLYKLLSSSKNVKISIGFCNDPGERSNKFRDYKLNFRGHFYVCIHLGDVFEFAEHQNCATFDFGCKLTKRRQKKQM